ncbi:MULTISPECIES: hypothetical protein [Kamptonema]|nr:MULTISPECIES: hypothetical protein [Kamptonema]
MQLTLIAGRYYFLEEPDFCSSRNISGISTWNKRGGRADEDSVRSA